MTMPPTARRTITVVRRGQTAPTRTSANAETLSATSPVGEEKETRANPGATTLKTTTGNAEPSESADTQRTMVVEGKLSPENRSTIQERRGRDTHDSVYGLVPRKSSGRHDKALLAEAEVESSASAIVANTAAHRHDTAALQRNVTALYRLESGLPDMSTGVTSFIAILLIMGFMAAILFFCVQFPPTLRWIRRTGDDRRGYYSRVKNNVDGRPHYSRLSRYGDLTSFTSSSLIDKCKRVISTSSDTPSLSTRRRRQHPLAVNIATSETAACAGLGITLPTSTRESHSRTISSGDIGNSKTLAGSPSPWQILTAPLPVVHKFLPRSPSMAKQAAQELRECELDVETGLLRPGVWRQESSPSPPASSHDGSSSSSSINLLGSIGDGVEYACGKLSRMMHDQVREDPAEGLLLPVRDSERERKQVGTGRLQAACRDGMPSGAVH